MRRWSPRALECQLGRAACGINEEQERLLNTDGLKDAQPTHLLLYGDGVMTQVVVIAGGSPQDGDGREAGPQSRRSHDASQ